MRPVWIAGLMVAAGLLAACGIPNDAHPTALGGGEVTSGLGRTTTSVTTPGPPARATVFLVQAERVVPIVRGTSSTDVQTVLSILLGGPTENELAEGLRTAISNQAHLRSVRVENATTAVIDLTSSFVEVAGQEQILAVAQVVLTATGTPGITSVRFALEGQPVEVPRSDGTLSSEPLSSADYADLKAG